MFQVTNRISPAFGIKESGLGLGDAFKDPDLMGRLVEVWQNAENQHQKPPTNRDEQNKSEETEPKGSTGFSSLA